VRYTDDRGKPRRATAYGKTEKEARQRLREMLRRIEDGQTPKDSTISLSQWTERWLVATAASRRATTQATYSSLLRTHALPVLGDVRLRDLTPAMIEDWALELGTRRAASTTRQALTVLAMVLDAAVKHELLRRNVARLVERPRQPRSEARSYSSEEVALVLNAAGADRLATFLTVTAYTGLRKGEVLALRWEDINLDASTPVLRVTGTLARVGPTLVRTEPKTESGRRVVPLVGPAADSLREQRRRQVSERLAAGPAWTNSGYVFTTEIGTPIDPRNALRWFYLVRDRIGVERMLADSDCPHEAPSRSKLKQCTTCGRKPSDYFGGSLHTLRHSAASVLLGAGVPMPVVKDILGHSSITITVDMYGHMAPTVVAAEMLRGMDGYGLSI
jgi:integrase